MRWILKLFGLTRKRRLTPSRRLDATIAYHCLLSGMKSASTQRPIESVPPKESPSTAGTLSPADSQKR